MQIKKHHATKEEEIISIFGPAEVIVSLEWLARKKLRQIPVEDFPPQAPTMDAIGQKVRFAVIIKKDDISKFLDDIAKLQGNTGVGTA